MLSELGEKVSESVACNIESVSDDQKEIIKY